MPISDARRRANNKWIAKHEEVRFRVPLGQKETIKKHAESQGESVNAFMIRAVAEAMERDTKKEK